MGPNSALHGHSRSLDPLNGGLNLGLRHPENHSMVPYRGRSTKFLFYRFKPSPPTHKHMNQLGTVYTCDPSLGWNTVSTEEKKKIHYQRNQVCPGLSFEQYQWNLGYINKKANGWWMLVHLLSGSLHKWTCIHGAIERLNPWHVPTTVSCESPRDKCFFFFFFFFF